MLAAEVGKGPFDHAGTEAQATGRQQGSGLAQIGEQALLEAGLFVVLHESAFIAGGVQHMKGMRKAEAIGIKIGLHSGLMHPGAHGIMRQQQPIEFLIEQFG